MKIKIDCGCTSVGVIDMVNAALERHGLMFVADEDSHDGYDIYELVEFEP